MAITKGYYNVNNKTFLGILQIPNDQTGASANQRYVEGVCFGEYNTETGEFIPETNPMVIPKGSVMTIDEDVDAFKKGVIKHNVTGIIEDRGADIARKKITPVLRSKKEINLKSSVIPNSNSIKSINLNNLFG